MPKLFYDRVSSTCSYLICIISLVFCSLNLCSQNLSFTIVTPPKEYPFTSITGITQDTLGYMWFTSGPLLYRYNGYEFTIYKNDSLNPNSLTAANLECVYADKSGFIWVGSMGDGLIRLDPQTGIFKYYRYDKSDALSISSDYVNIITEDHQGYIWIGTTQGLNRLDKKTERFINYKHDPKDSMSLSHNNVQRIYEDRSGTLWVGTGTPFFPQTTRNVEGGLNMFNRKTGKFIRYLHDPQNPHSLIDNRIGAIYEDSRGVFWVGTAGDGLHTMDRAKGTFERHLYNPAHPEKLSRPPLKELSNYFDDHITFITEDSTGAIWIGTMEAGINRYSPKTGLIIHYRANNNSDSLQDNRLWAIYSSREGVVWISAWRGKLYMTYPLRKNIPHFDVGRSVETFYEDVLGNLWLATPGGLVLADRNKKIIRRFTHDSLRQNSITDNNVSSVKEDKNGTLWIGTMLGGLNLYNPKTQTFSHYKHNPNKSSSVTNGDILAIFEDQRGSFWLGTTAGLDLMDRQTGTFTHYRNDPKDSNSLGNDFVTYISEDRVGNLWVATWNGGGINQLNRSTGKFKHYLRRANIISIYEDTDGIIWAGTNQGLYRYNKGGDAFLLYNDTGSSIETANITSIVEDDQKNLWISAYSGIFSLNRRRNGIRVYGKDNGLNTNSLIYLAGYKRRNGELLFGNQSGYYAFFPDELTKNNEPPQVVITNFKISDQPVKPGNGSPLNMPLEQTKEIRLAYNQNGFSFNIAGIHYSNPEENQCLFMLENYDNIWRRAGTERTAYYFNVPPGSYLFRVKAASSEGVWAEKSIEITIIPPWWSTWWFRITAVFCVFAIFYGLIRWRIYQKFRLQLERAEKEKQLAELQHKATELEMQALRAQMNPHFIFNCLSSINGFILKNETEPASDYLTKFSRLIRMVLTNSKKTFITLEDELEMLRLYLEMERLRFQYSFNYSISFKNEIDPDIIFIPPLLLQPFAENAIWHGLMHKQGEGYLEISLSLEEKILTCIIADNGIGRKKAAMIKSKSAEKQKSMGLQITAERLALLNQGIDAPTAFNIEDITDGHGNAAGTRVILKMHYRDLTEAIT